MELIPHFPGSRLISFTLYWHLNVFIFPVTSVHLIQSDYIRCKLFLFLSGAGKVKLEIHSSNLALSKHTHIVLFPTQIMEKQGMNPLLPFMYHSSGEHYHCFILMYLPLINAILEKIVSKHITTSHY